MDTRSFTVGDFLTSLKAGDFDRPTRPTIITEGMVKASDSGDDAIQFSVGGSCDSWMTIPANLIESVEFLRTVGCKDHSHPFVRLHLKHPDPENVIANVLVATLASRAPANKQPIKIKIPRGVAGQNRPIPIKLPKSWWRTNDVPDHPDHDPCTCWTLVHCADGHQYLVPGHAPIGGCDAAEQISRDIAYAVCDDNVLNYMPAGCGEPNV